MIINEYLNEDISNSKSSEDKIVGFFYYRPTMQEKAMHLMGSKLEVSLAIEGKFS